MKRDQHVSADKYLQEYCKIYNDITSNFQQQLKKIGVSLVDQANKNTAEVLNVTWRNDRKSCIYGQLSPACAACRTGEKSISLYISLMCHRKCYYCFNPNQQYYDVFCQKKKDVVAELVQYASNGKEYDQIALTGGEPLLHKQDSIRFFETARKLYPIAYLRLYTSGDLLDTVTFSAFQQAGLDEIRFSLKLEDTCEERELVYQKIQEAKQFIPHVMVEMPVIPGTLSEMQEILWRLDAMKIDGINLLEFCFPYNRATEFAKRGFGVKYPPFRILYDYDYAGGLPVAGSETEALSLIRFAVNHKLCLGVHYCSLENKQTAQIFECNQSLSDDVYCYFSPRDFFLKSIKIFGEASLKAAAVLQRCGNIKYRTNRQAHYVEFHPKHLPLVGEAVGAVRVGIAFYVREAGEDGDYLREVAIEQADLGELTIEKL